MVPVSGQKGLEIGCGNPHQSVEPVRDQKALIDPAPNGAGADAQALGDLFDREELLQLGAFRFHRPAPSAQVRAEPQANEM